MEGISHEAISFAGLHRLSKLTVLFDDNAISVDGSLDLTCSDNQIKRFEASGWHCQVINGHDPDEIAKALSAAEPCLLPSMIACKTIVWFGAGKKAGNSASHGSSLGAEEIAATRENLNWPHAPFVVPKNVGKAWIEIGASGAAELQAWAARLNALQLWGAFADHISAKLPKGWQNALQEHSQKMALEASHMATRQASGKTLEVLTAAIPALVGGSADLTVSVNTKTADTRAMTPATLESRFIHFGVREHAMGAMMNGLALNGGTVPYVGTFLVFANYMHASARLSVLMGLRVIYVLTHDSIGLGEDGPTHQPVENPPMLQATPYLDVFRPADAVETAEAWAHALERTDGPTAIVLSRQGLPTLRKNSALEGAGRRGGYVLGDTAGSARDVTLTSTDSEMSLAVAAQESLAIKGVTAAVLSLACWEMFDKQSAEYQGAVLGALPRIAIEAAGELEWHKYLAENGQIIGVSGFGAYGSAPEPFEYFGITPTAIEAAALAKIKSLKGVSEHG